MAHLFNSCIYESRVQHVRHRPKRHRFSYRVFFFLIDLDELPKLRDRLRLFSCNHFNLFSFFDRDHGKKRDRKTAEGRNAKEPACTREWAEILLKENGLEAFGASIKLLCFPRLFGYAFNPLSVYFCADSSGAVGAIIHEVQNRVGGRHAYVLPCDGKTDQTINQSCEKDFYVSPFIEMAVRYKFQIRLPEDRVSVLIRETNAEDQEVLSAALTGKRKALSDGALISLLLRYPLMTVHVVLGIHWQAFKLWRKGLRFISSRSFRQQQRLGNLGRTGETHPMQTGHEQGQLAGRPFSD